MCGILCLLNFKNNASNISNDFLKILKNRGPDVEANFKECNNSLNFFGFVLWQQGEQAFSQPAISEKYILLLNGDIFNTNKSESISDTEWLLAQLENLDTDLSIIKFLTNLEGPYSIIFYNKNLKTLYFARDPLGRNSLIAEYSYLNDNIKIASTSYMENKDNICIELPPVGIYKINLKFDSTFSLQFENVQLYLWKDILTSQKEDLEKVFRVPLVENIEYGRIGVKCLQSQSIQNYYNFYNIAKSEDISMSSYLDNSQITLCVEKVINLLKLSVKSRVLNTPAFCTECIREYKNCEHSKIGILFSGGLDCTILARLSHEFCTKHEPIDLINVAFESFNSKNEESINWNTPDRTTAIKSHEELCKLIPERKWNLILVNVTRKELNSYLSTNIKHLIYPLNTILDESLGASFWFASRGIGLLNNEIYQTTCRVILVGSGADEMFGGYTRHRNAFTRTEGELHIKLDAVGKELKLDWERISFRNLGRDDRVIADNCKTARSPYIEENLVSFVTNLQPEQKCCFALRQGIGDKLLLRLCGFKLGLHYSCTLQKRAIQFGSKIANKKENAADISKYLSTLDNPT